jgi:uncharacterized protein (TIGR02996 family)
MTDRELGLLRAVCADPADDAPRMILADWWDETGRPERAEFLRVQCALAGFAAPKTGVVCCEGKGPPAFAGSRKRCKCLPCALTRRERRLLPLISPHPEWIGVGPPGVFRRGFIERITLSAADWLRHADQLYWHPTQTETCPKCYGSRWVFADGAPVAEQCRCGSGRVPRPFPPTAQPIEAVRLTTPLTVGVGGNGWRPNHVFLCLPQPRRQDVRRLVNVPSDEGWPEWFDYTHVPDLLAAEWPHIRFTLPPATADWDAPATPWPHFLALRDAGLT